MQLFKAFFKIAKHNLPAISIYFLIYAAMTFLLGTTSQKNMDANFQSKALDICVIDEDHSTVSEAVVAYLDSMHHLVEVENDPAVLQDYLYYRYISYILTIPEGFEEKLLAGETSELFTDVKIPGSSTGYFADQQLSEYVQTLQLYVSGGYTLKDAISAVNTTLSEHEYVTSITFKQDTVSERKEIFYFYQYLPYIFTVLLISGLTPIILRFQEKEIHARISCSSEPFINRSFQIVLGSICYSLLTWLLFHVLATLVYGDSLFSTNALYAMLNSFAYLMVAVSITYFASSFAISDNVAHMIGNTIGLGMSFLCGGFVPQSMLSEGVLKVAKYLPMYWYLRANNMLAGFSKDAFDLHFYWTAIGIQLLFAAAFLAFALVASRMRRQNA